MPLNLLCPTCNAVLQAEDSTAGATVACPNCAAEMVVPETPSGPGDVPPPSSYPSPTLAKSVPRPPGPPPIPDDREGEEPKPSRRRSKRSRRDDDDDEDEDDFGERRRSSRIRRCRCCDSRLRPIAREQISQSGWIVFAVMLLVCWPLFFIGLLMKEDIMVCSDCGAKIGA